MAAAAGKPQVEVGLLNETGSANGSKAPSNTNLPDHAIRRKTMSNLGSKLERASAMVGSDDGEPLDSVLGNTSRDVLLKAVIQKVDFATRRLDDLSDKFTNEMAAHNTDQQKMNKYLMDAQD